jgi:enoyl-CoA hydratase
MAVETPVRYRRRGAIAQVTLNRPGALNAINAAMRDGLTRAMAKAESDPEVRVVLVAGAGERAFCAGADITEFEAPASVVAARASRQTTRFTDQIAAVSKPVIAAIHGYCLGGGLEIAMACDIRIAADDARFGLPEVTLGIIPGVGGTQRLSRLVGVGPALRMTRSGERIDAAAALAIGLVGEVVARADLEATADALAERIAGNAPRALAYAKEAILRGHELSLADGLRLESDLATLLMTTADRLEGAAAFRERRKPVYHGE